MKPTISFPVKQRHKIDCLRLRSWLVSLTLVLLTGNCWTQITAQTLVSDSAQAMQQAAMQALEEHWQGSTDRIEIQMSTIDARLQIPVCGMPLAATANQPGNGNGGRVTVRVECQDASPWTRYVSANVKVFRPVAVSARALARGSVIQPHDVTMEELDISQLRGQTMGLSENIVGKALRRSVNHGTPLTLDMLTAPVLVKRGDTVVLIASRGGISIRHTGTALQDGEAGQQIPVRNNSSERVVQAVVREIGVAEVVF
ncbi:flagellar basal body P-ring formation chaperone FlgA [Pseudohongiella spirulinae]|nr:flagellar basal body P-ring formation chaperone FlgA [Pseudohongiella spirulinae]